MNELIIILLLDYSPDSGTHGTSNIALQEYINKIV